MELALRYREDEAGARAARRHNRKPSGLLLDVRTGGQLAKAQHFLDLLGRVVLAPAKDVRLGAFGVAELVDLSLG